MEIRDTPFFKTTSPILLTLPKTQSLLYKDRGMGLTVISRWWLFIVKLSESPVCIRKDLVVKAEFSNLIPFLPIVHMIWNHKYKYICEWFFISYCISFYPWLPGIFVFIVWCHLCYNTHIPLLMLFVISWHIQIYLVDYGFLSFLYTRILSI